jgi:hypothetical protein
MNLQHPSARRRDRYRLAVTALTGVVTAGCLTATGWIVGQAAHSWTRPQPATTTPAAPPTASHTAPSVRRRSGTQRPRVVLRARPTRTRVTTRYVTPPAPVGGGGTVGSAPTQASPTKPVPAPSSGS